MGSNEQSYISMIADSNDNIHAVYRRWIPETDSNGEATDYGVLAYQKFNGSTWSTPTTIVYPNISGYFVYYQRLATDQDIINGHAP